jgi:alpha-beta hydrolase superfamily lysophospholipase
MSSEQADPVARYVRGSFKTGSGYDLATYTWYPDCPRSEIRGSIFALHGVHSHARYEFLEPNEEHDHVKYEGSIYALLNSLGLVVFAHDHPGHGETSGLRGYFNSMDEVRDAAIEYSESVLASSDLALSSKPHLVVGMSMGGTVAVEIARIKPELFTGYILLSPAVKPPDDMFGPLGRVIYVLRTVLNMMAPKLKTIKIPPSPDPALKASFLKDQLIIKDGFRVRVGSEHVRCYEEIQANAASIKFPAVIIFVGAKDPIVSPSGIMAFTEKIQCPDHEVKLYDNLGHEVLTEAGNEQARRDLAEWIEKQLSSSALAK